MEQQQGAILKIAVESAEVLNFASAVNSVPVIHRIELHNTSDKDLEDVSLLINASPAVLREKTIHVSKAPVGQNFVLEPVEVLVDNAMLMALNESIPVAVSITAKCGGQTIARQSLNIEAVAYEQWPGERLLPQLLAAFVQPNTKATAGVHKQAAKILTTNRQKALDGYQSESRMDVALQIAAAYTAVSKMGISYANPPASLAQTGQRVRTPARIVQDGLATCLDTTLLFASVLESIGLHPVLLLSRSHAWLGCWLTNNSLLEACTADAQLVRKRISEGEMIAFETTTVCDGNQAPFKVAVNKGAQRLDSELHDDFCFAIDVFRSRHQKIRPLPAPGDELVDQSPTELVNQPETDIDVINLPELADEAEPAVEADSRVTAERIEQWKSQLLDHSMRNRLLNCEPGKHSARFIHPNPSEIEDLLATDKKLKIDSLMDHAVSNDPRSEKLLDRNADRAYRDDLAVQALQRGRLVCYLDQDKTQKALTKHFRDAKTNEEETGSNTLYLCLGSLVWRPSGKSKDYQAPLLMLPIRLTRKSVGSGYSLVRHDDDPVLNPTLLQVLEEQFALRVPEISAPHALPTDESGIDVNRVLSLVKRAVAEQEYMEVRSDTIQLGNFSFAKYLLWMDLASHAERLLDHPLVNLMVKGDREAAESLYKGEFIDRHQLDEKVDVGELHLVTMADASQMVVIHEAAQGRSFVTEGPPGTGKSETITNLIADQLGRGNRVLFVSEKMEALDVVHRRLCKIGLEPFLMVLHAAKANKKDVIEQYRKAVEAAHARQPQGWEDLRKRLRRKRDQLNAYVNVLHSPGSAGLTVYEAIARTSSHPDWKPAELSWPSLESVSKDDYEQMLETSKNIAVLAADFGGFRDNPLSSIHATTFSPSWREKLFAHAESHVSAFDQLHAKHAQLAAKLKIPSLRWYSKDYEWLSGLFQALLNPPQLPGELIRASNIDEVESTITQVRKTVADRRQFGDELFANWIDDVLLLDVADFKLRWRAALGKFWPLSWFAKFGLRGQLAPYSKTQKRPNADFVLKLLDAIAKVQSANQVMDSTGLQATKILGRAYQGLETDDDILGQSLAWVSRVDLALEPIISSPQHRWAYLKAVIKWVSGQREQFSSAGKIGTQLQEAINADEAHRKSLAEICELAAREISEVVADGPDAYAQWASQVRSWSTSANGLQPWCVWRNTRREAMSSGLAPLVSALEVGDIDPDNFESYFKFSFANWWLNKTIDRTPLLQNFSRPLHEAAITEFKQLDNEFIGATRKEIFAKLAANVPRPDINIPGSPIGFLRDQMTRQRGHRPVREIIQKLGDQNQRLKPCMMMSPLTVAQYLEVADTQFDIVVFDEASQIKTCDAIGVIARAPQVIVVGDSKQLPPTSFFATGKQGEDSEVRDHESILDECSAVLPSHRLNWHYRSRNEELIAFSNDRYYEGELITMPGPTTARAVSLHKVPGIYDRGKSRTNRREADAVVQFIQQRVLSPRNRLQSLGVVTFSAAQQNLIQDLLDRACAENLQLENAVKGAYNNDNQELFVKNLESVQGDQRDVIVFSICYGPTHSGTVYNEFGPLNREGGQRRLNVAVTRAAEEVHVFTSMDPEDIKSAYLQTSATGVGDLKRYLQFARDGVGALETYSAPSGRDADSDFERQVIGRLAERGWEIHAQVGVSKFRIDLAVVDPRKPGRYLAGVECDGATYHSSATARDRDIVRQGVLENLGWKILRIWSTDWWNNADAEVERIHAALLKIKDQSVIEEAPEEFEFDPNSSNFVEPMDDGFVSMVSKAERPVNDEQILLRADGGSKAVHKEYPQYTDVIIERQSVDLYDFKAAGVAQQVAMKSLNACAPMLEEVLFRKVMEAFGQKRLTEKASRTLKKYLGGFVTSAEGSVCVYWKDQAQAADYADFRVGASRTVFEIPLVELSNLSSEVLSHAIQCSREDLARAICGILGIKRMSADIQQRLNHSFDTLIAQSRAEHGVDHTIRHLIS